MSWDVHNQWLDYTEAELALGIRIRQAMDRDPLFDSLLESPDCKLSREELRWYIIGGYDSINPILRSTRPSTLRLPGHRNNERLRTRVKNAVHAIDMLPRISLTETVTFWRGESAKKKPAFKPGSIRRDRAYTSCSLRHIVADDACLRYVKKDERSKHTAHLYEIEVPAGIPFIPALHITAPRSSFDTMIANEAEMILPRHVQLRIASVKRIAKDRYHIKAVAEITPERMPMSDILPTYPSS